MAQGLLGVSPLFSQQSMGTPALPTLEGLSPAQPDYLGMAQALGGFMGGQQQPQPMMPAPAPQIQIGGEQFMPAYQGSQFAPQPTAQALQGLLGGVMGNGTF